MIGRPLAGDHLAGVEIRRHTRYGHELAVVTTPPSRGRGLGSRLVAQAARRVLDEGAIPFDLHEPANIASAHVADTAGFSDHGWITRGLRDIENPAATATRGRTR